MMRTLQALWQGARLAEKDGFLLMVGSGHAGMPWWNREHVHAMVATWRGLPKHEQTEFLAMAVNEVPEVHNEDA